MPKYTELTARALPPAITDIISIVIDPGGTPLSRKLSIENFFWNSAWSMGANQMTIVQGSAFGLVNQTALQIAFPAAQGDMTLLADTTYYVEGIYYLATGGTTHTTSIEFLAGAGLTITSFNYASWAWSSAANAIASASSNKHNTGIGAQIVTATSTAVRTQIAYNGILRVNAGGTLTPRVGFSAAPGGTNQMLVDSYCRLFRVGAGAFVKHDAWA